MDPRITKAKNVWVVEGKRFYSQEEAEAYLGITPEVQEEFTFDDPEISE